MRRDDLPDDELNAYAAATERCYRLHEPHLWPWAGWYALILGDRLLGVFPDAASALRYAYGVTVDRSGPPVVRQIEGTRTAPTFAADGGVPHAFE